MRADAVFPSPLGLLIHAEFGLWHAYRAALLFAEKSTLPARKAASSPCESCVAKPCLAACPVDAFSGSGYDVPRCAAFLDTEAGEECMDRGCRARRACPVGLERAQEPAQAGFHMRAFRRGAAR
jgi:epoxyqueuosine reductase QueG